MKNGAQTGVHPVHAGFQGGAEQEILGRVRQQGTDPAVADGQLSRKEGQDALQLVEGRQYTCGSFITKAAYQLLKRMLQRFRLSGDHAGSQPAGNFAFSGIFCGRLLLPAG